MRSHSIKIMSAVMYILSFCSFFSLIGADVLSTHSLPYMHFIKIITAFLVFVFGYFGAFFYCRGFSKERPCQRLFRNTFILLFLVYCFIVIDFTLVDDTFGRSVSSIFSLERQEIISYLKENTNIIPFATVKLFWKGYQNGLLSIEATLENILGNFLVFMPFALFLPIVSERFHKAKYLIPTVVGTVLTIEILQLIMLTGSADIDDLILNVLGAVVAHIMFKTNRLNSMLKEASFGVWSGQNQ